VKFFVDNCLAPAFARALGALSEPDGHQVIHLSEKFPRNVPDATWIKALAHEGDWIIISGDLRITRNAHERAAWNESKLLAFFLAKGWMNIEFWDQASRLVHWWPRIVDQAGKVAPPGGFIVPFKGAKLELVTTAR
jgi:hypothetical protein